MLETINSSTTLLNVDNDEIMQGVIPKNPQMIIV